MMDLSALLGPVGWPALLHSTLGFSDADLAKGDDRVRWLTSCERNGAQLQTLNAAQLNELQQLWPAGTTIEVLLGNHVAVDVRAATALADLARLVAGAQYEVRLTVDKDKVLGALGTSPKEVRWFVSPQAVKAMTGLPYRRIEQEWFEEAPTAIVVVSDADVCFVGEFLTIVGGGALVDVQSPQPSAAAMHTHQRQIGWRDSAFWEDADLARATPAQMEVSGRGWGHPIGAFLAVAAARLTLLYTADRARHGSFAGALIGEYHGKSAKASIDFSNATPSSPETTARSAHGLMSWAFGAEATDRAWQGDRIELIRVVILDRLDRFSDAERQRRFLDDMGTLFTDAKWHWRLFLSGKLDDHVAAVDTFGTAVVAAVDSYTKSAADVVASIIDGMKAAVATVLGSFIGAALATDFKEVVFRVGMLVYAIYIIAFPGILGLGSEVHRHSTAKATFDATRTHAVDVLGEQRVEAIESSRVASARRAFWTSIIVAATIFTLVAIAACIAQRAIPPHIK